MHKTIEEYKPNAIVLDPISNLVNIADVEGVKIALMRLIDLLKSKGITSIFTYLLQGNA